MITDKYQLELRHLRYFITVAEELHFRKAAEKLFIAQPGLSRQIKQLEDTIGYKLFHRHQRKVELTVAGAFLAKECKKVFSFLEGAIDQAAHLSAGNMGELKIGYVGSAMQEVLPPILKLIRKEFPEIHFDLRQWDNQRQVEAIMDGTIDIGFVRVDSLPASLKKKEMQIDTYSLVLPRDHPISNKSFKDISQLKAENFILFDPSYSESYYRQMMRIFDDAGFVPNIAHKTVHASTIYSLVENGFGVSVVPSSLKKGYDYNLKFIEMNRSVHRTTLHATWNPENRNPSMEHFLSVLKGVEA